MQIESFQIVLLLVGALIGLCLIGAGFAGIVRRSPYPDVDRAMIYSIGRLYARWVHNLEVVGREHLDALRYRPEHRPVIIVANHTAGVDPVLVGVCSPVPLRWLMAEDMRLPSLQWFWDLFGVIFVARVDRRGHGMRDALRELKNNGVLGIFPEGALERPPERLLKFQPGVGMLIAKAKPIVVPVIIDGTPQFDPAWASLWHASRSRLRVLPWWEPPAGMTDPVEIANALQALFVQETGWEVAPDDATIDAAPGKGRVAA